MSGSTPLPQVLERSFVFDDPGLEAKKEEFRAEIAAFLEAHGVDRAAVVNRDENGVRTVLVAPMLGPEAKAAAEAPGAVASEVRKIPGKKDVIDVGRPAGLGSDLPLP